MRIKVQIKDMYGELYLFIFGEDSKEPLLIRQIPDLEDSKFDSFKLFDHRNGIEKINCSTPYAVIDLEYYEALKKNVICFVIKINEMTYLRFFTDTEYKP